LLSCHADKLTHDGRQRLVRHGRGEGCERFRFLSAILPPYALRSKSLEVLIPILYLKGISTCDFEDALIALLGRDAGGLSASTIGRLKEVWCGKHARWSNRDLSADPPPLKWSDLRYVFDIQEDCNGKEAIQA
jgi:putative transposase